MKNDLWPVHNVERRPLASLVPYAGNARTHSPEQVSQIAASMREWGWTMPVLVDEEGGIIAGHGRALAAKELAIEEIPVIVARGWTPAQKRAYVLADNKLAENAGWDRDLLKVEVGALGDLGFDLGLAGFSGSDLAEIAAWGKTGHTDPDAVPEPPAVAATQAGDVWLLGPHRLVCGDCTDPAVVGACLGREKPLLMVTDPPYGVEYDPDWRNQARRAGSMGALGASSTGKVHNDDQADWRKAWARFPGDVAYVWHAGRHASAVQVSLEASDFEIRSQIIWVKQHLVISRGNYHWMHEPCWYAVRRGGTAHWAGDRKQTTVWQIANSNAFGGGEGKRNSTNHGTQKPVECMKRPIENNSKPGGRVYDPFVGSGTTIIAAEMTGRICHAIELDPIYVDVAVRRWEEFTGQHAIKAKEASRATAA